MSGMAGICRADGGPVERTVLDRMLVQIAHRGPDRRGQWMKGPIALGHCLLFTTPESLRERQPVASPGDGVVLVWDGRLDNRSELAGTLEQAGIALGAKTDPELVLGAYRHWGEECPPRLLGDFAFAVWNERDHSLFCARDRLGLKPFHYAWDGQTFLFSSEVRSLCAGLGTTPEPDDEMVLAFLLREFRERDAERTLYRGIHRLPPGHALHLKDGRARVSRYWAIDPARETRYGRDEDYAAHFRCLFQEAVRCRLRSYFPIGALVSGGLDSSAIVCMAEKLGSAPGGPGTVPPIEAFTLFSDTARTDERPYFHQVINATGLKAHAVGAAPDPDPLDGLDEIVQRTESPIIGIGHQDGRRLMDAIGLRGCRVLLSGEGGDQLLDGIGYLSDLLTGRGFWRFPHAARTMAAWYGASVWELIQIACAIPLPPPMKFWGKRLGRGVPPGWMNPALAGTVGLRARVHEPRHRVRFPSFCQSDTHLALSSPYYVLKLELEERGAAAHGMEFRYPFLDSRLVEFVLSIPPARRTWDGVWKGLLREAMRGVLPETIRMRKGKGDWTEESDRALTALCRRDLPLPLENRSGQLERYLDLNGARALVMRYLAGERGLRHDIWFLITLDRWLAWLGQGGR